MQNAAVCALDTLSQLCECLVLHLDRACPIERDVAIRLDRNRLIEFRRECKLHIDDITLPQSVTLVSLFELRVGRTSLRQVSPCSLDRAVRRRDLPYLCAREGARHHNCREKCRDIAASHFQTSFGFLRVVDRNSTRL